MDKDKESHSIDLGFADLLGGDEPIGKPVEEPAPEIIPAEPEGEKKISFEDLWREKNYTEVISLSDVPAEENDNPSLRKLWWIRAQIVEGELPKQVLCSSLEECLAPDNVSQIPAVLISATSLELAEKLQDVQEEDLAIAVLEKSFSVAPEHTVAAKLGALIDKELGDLPKRVTFHSSQELKKRLHLLNVKRLVDDFLKHNTDDFVIGSTPEIRQSSEMPPPVVVQGSGPRILVPMVLLVLLLVTAAIYFSKQHLFPSVPELFAGEIPPLARPSEKLVRPEVARIKEVSQLASVMYDVEKRGDATAKQDVVAVQTPSKSVTQPLVQQPVIPKVKAHVDTSGPLETDRIRQFIDGNNGSKYDDTGPPLPRFPRTNDRDLSHAPIIKDPAQLDRERRDDPDRAQTWSGGERYEVMINTSVMDRPSFHAGEVAELYVGDRVLVEARVGRWLRIRSVKGKPGFIMAQDAEKLFD